MNEQINQATGAAAERTDRSQGSTRKPTQRSTVLASCVCAILTGGPAAALELGEPVVRSTLGQPLEVVVPYAAWGNERLTADCVSLVRGDATGLPAVTAGRVSSTAGNRLVIRSDRGIREPLLGLNLKVDCPATPFIIRSYTLIIDPPGLAPVAREPAPLPAPTREPAEPAAVLPSASAGNRTSRAAGPVPAEPLTQGTGYRVRVGDTLSTIAQRVSDRPEGIWPTAERIFAANPEAFIGGDMNRLRAGSVIEIPMLTDGPATAAASAERPSATPAAPAASAPEAAPSGAGAGQTAVAGRAATPAGERPSVTVPTSATAAAPATSAQRIRPAVRQAMDEMAAAPSPFKPDTQAENTPDANANADADAALTPAGPAPRLAAAEPATPSAVSPLFAALFGAGIGLLMGLVIFRSSVREFFRRAPTPAAARGRRPVAGASAVAAADAGGDALAASGESTDVMAAPVFEPEEPDVIVSEEAWDDVTQSRLKSLDIDFGDEDDADMGVDVITEQELAVARMDFPLDDDSDTVPETDGAAVLPPEDRIEESMIMEVDTGAELAADTPSREQADAPREMADDTGTLATVADLEMLEEDYEQEFTATQRLAKQLADAAIALDREISAHGDDLDEDIAEENIADEAAPFAATAILNRDTDIIDEADQTAVLSADDATAVSPAGDEGDTVEHTGVYAAATAELPSADAPFADDGSDVMTDEDDESDRETAVIPLSEKRRA